MPPTSGSRYAFSVGVRDEHGRLFLAERTPYRYREHSDTRTHIVAQGDTLWGLAGTYFSPMPRACGWWWLIGDFQPTPILDPTIELEPGRRLFIPSLRVVTDIIFSERRRGES